MPNSHISITTMLDKNKMEVLPSHWAITNLIAVYFYEGNGLDQRMYVHCKRTYWLLFGANTQLRQPSFTKTNNNKRYLGNASGESCDMQAPRYSKLLTYLKQTKFSLTNTHCTVVLFVFLLWLIFLYVHCKGKKLPENLWWGVQGIVAFPYMSRVSLC
jgi:hypothetical protein